MAKYKLQVVNGAGTDGHCEFFNTLIAACRAFDEYTHDGAGDDPATYEDTRGWEQADHDRHSDTVSLWENMNDGEEPLLLLEKQQYKNFNVVTHRDHAGDDFRVIAVCNDDLPKSLYNLVDVVYDTTYDPSYNYGSNAASGWLRDMNAHAFMFE